MSYIPATATAHSQPSLPVREDANTGADASSTESNFSESNTGTEPFNTTSSQPLRPIAPPPALVGLAAPRGSGVRSSPLSSPSTRSHDFRGMAYEILETQPSRRGAAKLGNRLLELGSPEERSALMKSLVDIAPSLAVTLFSEPNQLIHFHGNISRSQRDAIAQALGDGFDSGALSKSLLGTLLEPRHHGPHSNPSAFAEMIARSESPALMQEASMQMLAIAQNDTSRWNNLWAYNVGAAAAASGSNESANHLINQLDATNQLAEFTKAIRPRALNTRADAWGKPVLGNLLKAASEIQPPTSQTDILFDAATKVVDNERSVREGLAAYFTANTEYTTHRLGSVSGDILTKRATLVRLSEEVLCAPSFNGQQEAQTAFGNELRRRIRQLQNLPTPPTTETRIRGDELARELGSLIGGLEVGFRRALQNAEDENESRQFMAGMLFDVVADPLMAAIPFDISIPRVGSLKDQSKAWVEERLFSWVEEDEPSVQEMVRPFYQLALLIPGDHTDEMEAIAGRFHDNELLGLLDE